MIEESSPVLSKLTSQQETPRRGKLHLPPSHLEDVLDKKNTRYASHLGLGWGGGGPEDLGGEVLQVLKTLKMRLGQISQLTLKKRLGSLMLKLQYDQKRQWGQPDHVSV
jgi:hypothetical protein